MSKHSGTERSSKSPTHLAFPVLTRQTARIVPSSDARGENSSPGEHNPYPNSTTEGDQGNSDSEAEDDAEDTGDGDRDSESENEAVDPAEQTEFKRLKCKPLKELNLAIHNYSPTAPFTFSMLEALSGGGRLIPAEWYHIMQVVLTCGQ